MDLTDDQWAVLEPLLSKPRRRPDGRGRPWRNPRDVLNGILWILNTGAPWHDLPRRYPPYQTCHRRYQAWVRAGVLDRVLYALAEGYRKRGHLDLTECFVDGTFVIAKKGAQGWDPPSGAKVRRSWQWQMQLVFLSPSTWPVLHRLNARLSSRPSPVASRGRSPSG